MSVHELFYAAIVHLIGLRDDKGEFLGAEVVLHPLGNGLAGPVLNAHTASHMTCQLLVDIRAEHLIGHGIVTLIFLHIRIQELTIVSCP